jgi:hypothetical protein
MTGNAMTKKKAKKKETVKQRVSKVDERVPALFERYPLVGAVVFGGGVLVGMLVMWFF